MARTADVRVPTSWWHRSKKQRSVPALDLRDSAPERPGLSDWVVEQIGSKVRLGAAPKALPFYLNDDEDVLCVATGFLAGHTGLVAATQHRLLFIKGWDLTVSDEYSEIRRYRARAGLSACDLYIEDESGIRVIKQIYPNARLHELTQVLADHASMPAPAPVAAPATPGDGSIDVALWLLAGHLSRRPWWHVGG